MHQAHAHLPALGASCADGLAFRSRVKGDRTWHLAEWQSAARSFHSWHVFAVLVLRQRVYHRAELYSASSTESDEDESKERSRKELAGGTAAQTHKFDWHEWFEATGGRSSRTVPERLDDESTNLLCGIDQRNSSNTGMVSSRSTGGENPTSGNHP